MLTMWTEQKIYKFKRGSDHVIDIYVFTWKIYLSITRSSFLISTHCAERKNVCNDSFDIVVIFSNDKFILFKEYFDMLKVDSF
jgi:hypothetical protein